jgi:hypothetical protein
VSIGVRDERLDLIPRDRGVVLGNLVNRATKLCFLDDLLGWDARSLDKRDATLLAGNPFNYVAFGPLNLRCVAHSETPLYIVPHRNTQLGFQWRIEQLETAVKPWLNRGILTPALA